MTSRNAYSVGYVGATASWATVWWASSLPLWLKVTIVLGAYLACGIYVGQRNARTHVIRERMADGYDPPSASLHSGGTRR
jgi:hypothetical protein